MTQAAIKQKTITLKIEGISPYISHNWSKKALAYLVGNAAERRRLRAANKKEGVDPEEEAREALYLLPDGTPGLPAMAIKKALISAAHKDLGVEKTIVRKAVFLHSDGNDQRMHIPLVRLRGEWETFAALVRVGASQSEMRYRPRFNEWSAEVTIDFESGQLAESSLRDLLDRAGFSVGVGDWRPEKDGESGRFTVADA